MGEYTDVTDGRLPDIELSTADGERVELGTFLDRMLLAVAVRYYG